MLINIVVEAGVGASQGVEAKARVHKGAKRRKEKEAQVEIEDIIMLGVMRKNGEEVQAVQGAEVDQDRVQGQGVEVEVEIEVETEVEAEVEADQEPVEVEVEAEAHRVLKMKTYMEITNLIDYIVEREKERRITIRGREIKKKT